MDGRPRFPGGRPGRGASGGISVVSRGGLLVVSRCLGCSAVSACLCGVSVVSRWLLSGFLVVSCLFFLRVLVVSWLFLGGASMVGGVSVVSTWYLGGV